MIDPFADLPKNHFATVLADPPWRYRTWNNATAIKRHNGAGTNTSAEIHYRTMEIDELCALPVASLTLPDAALLVWATWPCLLDAVGLMQLWGFSYKTCAFDWVKANAKQIDLFRDDLDAHIGMGHWTRANTEPCLLATRGSPKRKSKGVRMGIIEPRREHSRKPDCVYERIEALLPGPYLELFARGTPRPGWTFWGNEVGKFTAAPAATVAAECS